MTNGKGDVSVTENAGRARWVAENCLAATMPRRWAHVVGVVEAVRGVAHILSPADRATVLAAAWLHDIGVAKFARRVGSPPVDGAALATELGFPSGITSLIAHHGASLEPGSPWADHVSAHPIPPRALADVLMFAELTTTAEGRGIAAPQRIANLLAHGQPWDPTGALLRAAAPGLLAAVERVNAAHLEWIRSSVGSPSRGGHRTTRHLMSTAPDGAAGRSESVGQ